MPMWCVHRHILHKIKINIIFILFVYISSDLEARVVSIISPCIQCARIAHIILDH